MRILCVFAMFVAAACAAELAPLMRAKEKISGRYIIGIKVHRFYSVVTWLHLWGMDDKRYRLLGMHDTV